MSESLRAMYAQSLAELKPDDSAQIDKLVAEGRFVLVMEVERYCQYTDASLPDANVYCGDYATYNEAIKAAYDQGLICLPYKIKYKPAPKPEPEPLFDIEDSIPF